MACYSVNVMKCEELAIPVFDPWMLVKGNDYPSKNSDHINNLKETINSNTT